MSSFPTFAGNGPANDVFRMFNTGGGGTGEGPATPGSNQFMPANPATVPMPGNTGTPPGIVPPAQGPSLSPPSSTPTPGFGSPPGSEQKLSGGNLQLPTFDPKFTQQFYQWLTQQLGKGATPFDLSAILPSTGQATTPGTLTAPLNPLEQSLEQFYKTGSVDSGPMPGVLPMWNAAIAAMNGPQGPIAQEEARIRGQFAFGGNLDSSPFAQAMTQFGEQTALNQNALLTQATQQALPTMQDFAGNLQSLDQSSINNMLAEFIRTRPEYSPYLNMLFGGATSSPGVMSNKGTGIGGVGALLSGAGAAAGGVADIISILKGGNN